MNCALTMSGVLCPVNYALMELLGKSQVLWTPPSLDHTEKIPLTLFRCGFIYWKRVWISLKVRLLGNLATSSPFPWLRTDHQHPSACWSASWALDTIEYQWACGALLITEQQGCQGGKNSLEALSILLCSLADKMEGPFYVAQISSNCQKENTRPV